MLASDSLRSGTSVKHQSNLLVLPARLQCTPALLHSSLYAAGIPLCDQCSRVGNSQTHLFVPIDFTLAQNSTHPERPSKRALPTQPNLAVSSEPAPRPRPARMQMDHVRKGRRAGAFGNPALPPHPPFPRPRTNVAPAGCAMAEDGAEPPERLADIILETSPPHVGHNIKARRLGAGTSALCPSRTS